LEDGELMPEGENLRFELETRPNGEPEGGEQGHKQGWHAGRERYQSPGRICNGDKKFGVSGRDSRYFWNKRTADGLRRSIECFERAIEMDGAFVLAYTGLADAWCLLADYGLARPADAMPRARAAAIRALELDPRSTEAHASFAFIRSVYDWEWAEAEALYRRAIELGPGYATAYNWLANDFLSVLGRLDEAADEIEIARQVDPLSLIISEGRAYLFTLARRYDKAIETYQALIDLDPSFFKFYTSMGRAYMLNGMYADAIAMLEQGRALAGELPSILGALGQTYAAAGDRAAAQRLLDELKGMASNRPVPVTCFALVHAGLGEYEAALDWLERGCAQHELRLPAINVHPAYDALRDRPRFTALLRRMLFPS
jgi:serine/threonine-protein kinase